jgi:hypothetical protein
MLFLFFMLSFYPCLLLPLYIYVHISRTKETILPSFLAIIVELGWFSAGDRHNKMVVYSKAIECSFSNILSFQTDLIKICVQGQHLELRFSYSTFRLSHNLA